jgi:phospholipid/cholesterol/gamma-HCH transport system substrate-binding protein
MASNRRYELGVGCLLLAAALVLGVMALQVGALSQIGSNATHVTARFTDAAGLQKGASVSIAGVEVGKVASLKADYDSAIVTMDLDPDAGVNIDAKVRIRARSLLGEKYVEVLPGDRKMPAVQDGAQLAVDGQQVEVDELLSKLGPLLDGIDAEQAGRVVKALADALQKDPERLSRMLDNADHLLANGATASDQLPQLMSDGSATLAQARSTLSIVDARARQGGDLIAHADRVLDDVSTATNDIPELVGDAHALIGDGRTLVGSLQESQGQLKIVLDNFEGFDTWELRRLLREEGILVRFTPREVDPNATAEFRRHGKVKE